MEIKLAKSYGFCFGVKRAIKIAENAGNAVTIGPLIHNNAEINRLKENFNVTTLKLYLVNCMSVLTIFLLFLFQIS